MFDKYANFLEKTAMYRFSPERLSLLVEQRKCGVDRGVAMAYIRAPFAGKASRGGAVR
jgi:hypothetical protein